VDNEFFRDGPVAAHLVLRPGPDARVLVAFPAGNSGAALWFAAPAGLTWGPVRHLRAELRTGDGGTLRGVTAEVPVSGGPLVLRRALVGSVRALRQFEDSGIVPPGVDAAPMREGRTLIWQRRRLDGAPGYRLEVEPLNGEISGGGAEPVTLAAGRAARLRLRVTALTGDPPLAALAAKDLVTEGASRDLQLRQVLEYLSYQDKLLAGSWRFDTYFGRDTLMTLCLLGPVARPGLAEAGLQAVLDRLNAAGEVAHEEDIGEYAILRRIGADEPATDAPIYDYRMVDDDFMLAVAAAAYLLDTRDGRQRAPDFLARGAQRARRNGAALVGNFRFVVAAAAGFARSPDWTRLVALKPGAAAGNWRDSESGLGHGRYPYDVNGALVPGALAAIARFAESGLLAPYVDGQAAAELARARAMAAVWTRAAPPLFDVRVAPAEARAAISAYATSVGVDARPALRELAGDGIGFRALALDSDGKPVAVQNSDEAFSLLLLDLVPDEVARIATTLARPFPAGLMTGAGMLVANPAFADAALQPEFDKTHYHGTVVWSWQQALVRAGIERQLARRDLPRAVLALLERTRAQLRSATGTTQGLRGSELWSWSWSRGRYSAAPFGQLPGDETESNAAQLWSTVHLAAPGR
jgi:glycogen debranching enzyme